MSAEGPGKKKNTTESVLDFRLQESDSPETTAARTDAFEKLMDAAEEVRKAGLDPNNLYGYQRARREYEKLNELLDDFGKGNDTEKDLLEPQIQQRYDYFIKTVGENLGAEIASKASERPGASLEVLNGPAETPVLANPIDRPAEEAKLKAVIEQLQGVDDPHDSWDPKAFKKYEKEHAATPAPVKTRTPRKKSAANLAAPAAPEVSTQAEKHEAAAPVSAPVAEVAPPATASKAATSKPEVVGPPQSPKVIAANLDRLRTQLHKAPQEKSKAGFVMGESFVPEGVKTNAERKAEFLATKTTEVAPVQEEVVTSMAERLYAAGGGGEMIRRVAEKAIADRQRALTAEAARMGGNEVGFLRRTGDRFNKMPHKKKILAGAALLALLGAAALNEPAVVSGFEHALRTVQETGQSGWHGFSNWFHGLMGGSGVEQHAADAAKGAAQKVAEHHPAVQEGMSVAEKALVEHAQWAANKAEHIKELHTIFSQNAVEGHEAAAKIWQYAPDPAGFDVLHSVAGDMQPDPKLAGEILAGNVSDPNVYLLQDGRASVFGGSFPSTEETVKAWTEMGARFAERMRTDVALPITDVEHGGRIMDLIIHADGTTEVLAPHSAVPLVEQVVMQLP